MLKKLMLSMIVVFLTISVFFLAAQPSNAATIVSIQATGPLSNVVGGFQFDILGPAGTLSSNFTPSLPSGWVDGNFGLARSQVLYFDGAGTTALSSGPLGSFLNVNAELANFLLFDQSSNQIPATNYFVQLVGTDYIINAVPIPPTIMLLGGGLIGLLALRRRRA